MTTTVLAVAMASSVSDARDHARVVAMFRQRG